MTAGLPGTGIGGLFYMLLVLLMPLREIWRTLRGQSSAERWKSVAVHWALAGGIIGALAGGGWILRQGFEAMMRIGLVSPLWHQNAVNAGTVTTSTALLAAGGILLGVVGGMALLNLILRSRPRPPQH